MVKRSNRKSEEVKDENIIADPKSALDEATSDDIVDEKTSQ